VNLLTESRDIFIKGTDLTYTNRFPLASNIANNEESDMNQYNVQHYSNVNMKVLHPSLKFTGKNHRNRIRY